MRIFILLLFLIAISVYPYELKINVIPSDAEITLNGKILKENPVQLNNGRYDISICKLNYECFNKKIWIIDENKTLSVNLKPLKAVLVITSDNEGSEIYLDGVKIKKGDLLEFKKEKTVTIQEKK